MTQLDWTEPDVAGWEERVVTAFAALGLMVMSVQFGVGEFGLRDSCLESFCSLWSCVFECCVRDVRRVYVGCGSGV